MKKFMDIYKEELMEKGFMVSMDTEYCKIHKSSHKNCAGCESEDGCNRLCSLGIITATQMDYNPKTYDDYLKMMKDIGNKIRKIMDKDTSLEQIKTII